MSFSFQHVGMPRALGKYVAICALVASGLTLGVASTASAASNISEATGFPVNAESANLTSISISPQNVGDLVILSSQIHSQSITVTGVTSADTGTWTHAQSYVDSINGVITEEVWWAVVTATTAATPINLTYSAALGGLSPELVADSYTTSVPSTWSTVAGSGGAATFTTTIDYPSVTSSSATSQLYWGYSESTTGGVAGSTSGFTYTSTANGNLSIDNPALSPATVYAPTATQTPAGNTTSIAEIFAATANPTTVTFDNNTGAGTLTAETHNTPTALSLFSTGNMTKSGFYFTGWNTAANGLGTSYADGASYPFAASTTLYAQWAANVSTGPSLLSLGITAASGTVNYGSAFTPTASVTSGLTAGDTAAVSGTTFTYVGSGNTTYAASATAPTAVGTYSVTPAGSTVTVTPAADQSMYSTTYAYVSGVLTITASTLSVTAGNVSVKAGRTVAPGATVSGLIGADTASVSAATYTYTGTGSTTYAASSTAPKAAGTYSITPAAATVVVSPAADATNYGTNFTYVPGTLTITVPPVVLRATHIAGSIAVGHRVKVKIHGTGFHGRPKITSSSKGTVIVVVKDSGSVLTVWVTELATTRPGRATFNIRLGNGKSCKIGYVIK